MARKTDTAPRKRGRAVDVNSRNYLFKKMIFGEGNIPVGARTKWPKFAKDIYNRMLSTGTLIAYADELAQYPSTEIPENHRV